MLVWLLYMVTGCDAQTCDWSMIILGGMGAGALITFGPWLARKD